MMLVSSSVSKMSIQTNREKYSALKTKMRFISFFTRGAETYPILKLAACELGFTTSVSTFAENRGLAVAPRSVDPRA